MLICTQQVVIYSFSDDKARVVQVHFDGSLNRLVVRKTEYLPFSAEENIEDTKLFLRWIMNKPIGSTRFTMPVEDNSIIEGDANGLTGAIATPVEVPAIRNAA